MSIATFQPAAVPGLNGTPNGSRNGLVVPAGQANVEPVLNEHAKFPTASRLLRIICHVRDSHDSAIVHLSNFIRVAEAQIAGTWWRSCPHLGTRTPAERMPVSFLGEMYRTYLPHLMGEVLMPSVDPSGLGDRGAAKLLELRIRQWMDDALYAKEDEQSVMDSIIGCGVQYVYVGAGGTAIEVSNQNNTLDMGQPGVVSVQIPRMFVDPGAEGDWDEASFIGHLIEVDRGAMLEKRIGNEKVVQSLPNVWENLDDTKHEEDLDIREEQGYLEDKVFVYEATFTYRGQRFRCSLPPTDGVDEFVVDPYPVSDHQAEPEGSPYVVTQLNRLPHRIMPLSPSMAMMDAHLAKVGVVAKMMEQIENLERKYMAKPGAQESVMRLMKRGGDKVVIGDTDSLKEFILGGLVKESVEAYAFLNELGKLIGPNTDLAGGRKDPSETATGSSILAGNAAVAMGYWQKQVQDSRSKVLRRVAAILLQGNDRREFLITNPMTGDQIPVVWDAATQDISYDQYRYKIRTTSAAAGMDPRQKVLSLIELVRTLPEIVPIVMGLGGDPAKAVRILSDMAGMPELDEMIPTQSSMAMQTQMFQTLAAGGQAKPAGGGGPPGAGGEPQSAVGQLNSTVRQGAPAR